MYKCFEIGTLLFILILLFTLVFSIPNGDAEGGRGDCDGLNSLDAAHLSRRGNRRLPESPWGPAAIFGSLGRHKSRGNEMQELRAMNHQ
jgi:hypothetical protein